jgi:hypothetical protein
VYIESLRNKETIYTSNSINAVASISQEHGIKFSKSPCDVSMRQRFNNRKQQLCPYDSLWPFGINLEKIHAPPSRSLFIVALFGYRADISFDYTNICLAVAFNIVCNEALVTLRPFLYSPLERLYLINYLKYSNNCMWSEFLSTDPGVPGSIPGASRFSDKQRVWNGDHSA